MTDDEKAYLDVENCAVRIITHRDHTRAELTQKLKKRDFDAAFIARVLETFEGRGWINDAEFARHQAEILLERGWGPLQIGKKLRKHGVPGDLARSATEALDIDWVVACRARMEAKFGDEGETEAREKAVRHLRQRGFWESTIRRVILDSE